MMDKISKKPIRVIQNRFVICFMLLASVISVFIMILFFREDMSIKVKSLDLFTVGDIESIKYNVEYNGLNKDGSYSVNGWCIKPDVLYSFYNYGNDTERKSVYNFMQIGFIDGDTVYILPTKLENRDDVDQYINDGNDYKFCGFKSKISKKKVGSFETKYLVLIWQNPDGSQELYYL